MGILFGVVYRYIAVIYFSLEFGCARGEERCERRERIVCGFGKRLLYGLDKGIPMIQV